MTVDKSPLDSLILRYSKWWILKRAVAWLLRFKELTITRSHRSKEPSFNKDDRTRTTIGRLNLTVAELWKVETSIIYHVQSVAFLGEQKILTGRESDEIQLKKTLQRLGTTISKLNPQLNEHRLLLVGGSLKNVRIGDVGKRQVLLPYKHHLTDLIIKYFHVKAGLMGQEAVLTEFRRRY